MVIFDYATCHNLKPSLPIKMDDGDQYFEKKINFMSKIFIVPRVIFYKMDDNQRHQHDIIGVTIMELHSGWRWVVLTKLLLNCNELHRIYGELQLYNSCNLSVNIHNVYLQWIYKKLSYKANYKTPFFHASYFLLGSNCVQASYD